MSKNFTPLTVFLGAWLFIATTAHSSPRVEIFVTSWCKYCRALEQFLENEKIEFIKHDLERDPKAKSKYHQLGGGPIPLTIVDGTTIIRGFSANEIRSALAWRKKKVTADRFASKI